MRDGQGSSLCSVAESTCEYYCLSIVFGCFLSPLLMTNKKEREGKRRKRERESEQESNCIRFSSTASGFSSLEVAI